jgi:WD40 repeat protein
VHAPDDAWFVKGFLVKALNLPAGQVLLSSELDLGVVIVDELARRALSSVTVVVVSPAFLASPWAQIASQLATHQSVEMGSDGNATLAPALAHHGVVKAVAWSPDGKRGATASLDHTARLWDATNGTAITPALVHEGGVLHLVWSPDGNWVATASEDRTARVWDAANGRAVSPPLRHHSLIYMVAWSPDGTRVATASDDQTARVWDAASGLAVTPPLAHQGFVTLVTWSPDGKRIATASDDQTARVWEVPDCTVTFTDCLSALRRCHYGLDSTGTLVARRPRPGGVTGAIGPKTNDLSVLETALSSGERQLDLATDDDGMPPSFGT